MLLPNLNCRSLRFPMTRIVLAVAVLLGNNLFVAAASAPSPAGYSVAAVSFQQQDVWATIKTEEGALFVWNAQGLSFSLAIKGKDIKPVEDPEHIFITIDGRVLQVQLAAIKNFAPEFKEKKLNDKTILAAHRDWESQYLGELIHSKVTVQTFNAKLSNGTEAAMWQFDMPASLNAVAQKQLYLTLVAGDFVLMLNSEATAAISDADGRKFLLDTIATLKISPTPIDVKKLSESIRAGNKKSNE